MRAPCVEKVDLETPGIWRYTLLGSTSEGELGMRPDCHTVCFLRVNIDSE